MLGTMWLCYAMYNGLLTSHGYDTTLRYCAMCVCFEQEEMGDVLHYIDFHQLQIENKQYVQKIEERNQELLQLKMTTGNTVQVLNNLKVRRLEHDSSCKQAADIVLNSLTSL